MARPRSSALLATFLPLVLLATACADQPILEPAASEEPDLGAAPPGGLDVILVFAGGGRPCEFRVATTPTLEDAVARVRDGGTIRVCPGTYPAEEIVVDKAVTLIASGDRPLIQTAGMAAFFLRHASGTTVVSGIDFEGGTYGSLVAEGFDQIRVEDSSFSGTGTAGVVAQSTTVAGSRMVVESSSFSGKWVGVFAPGVQVVDVLGSTFRGQTFSAIQFQGSTSGRIEGNVIDGCGAISCIAAFRGTSAEIVGNRIVNARLRPTPGAIRILGASGGGTYIIGDNEIGGAGHVYGDGISVVRGHALIHSNRIAGALRGISMAAGSSGAITENVIDPCGPHNCINLTGSPGAQIRVQGNTLRSVASVRTRWGILAHNGSADGSIQILENTIEGVGAPANPADPNSYPLQVAYQGASWSPAQRLTPDLPLGASVTFSGNTIRNAQVGVRALHGGVVEGRDNTFDTLYGEVLGAEDRGENRLSFNDIEGYHGRSLRRSDNGTGDADFNGVLEVTCNWWGDASGPQNVGGVDAGAYSPWATSPIAGSGATSCGP